MFFKSSNAQYKTGILPSGSKTKIETGFEPKFIYCAYILQKKGGLFYLYKKDLYETTFRYFTNTGFTDTNITNSVTNGFNEISSDGFTFTAPNYTGTFYYYAIG